VTAEDLTAAWQEIAESPHGEGPYRYIQFRGGVLRIGAILRASDDRPGLLVRFPATDFHLLPQPESGRGFSFERTVTVGSGTLGLPILLGEQSALDMFALMGADLVNEAAREDGAMPAVRRVLRRISLWRRFMQKRIGLMSSEEVRGLFAELAVLERCAKSDGMDAALAAWHGPERNLHDFAFPECLMEVKSWHTENGGRVRISDPGQLIVDPVRPIQLIAVQLAVGPAGRTLAEAICVIRKRMDDAQSERFSDLLADYGFHDVHAAEYRDCLSVVGIEAYEVREAFPHIDVRTIPGGVSMLRYSIELGAIHGFRIANRWLASQ
jgi:hypothetical protein